MPRVVSLLGMWLRYYIDNTFLLLSVEPVVKDETRARVF